MALTPHSENGEVPPDCSIALKEWASICDALGKGRQAILFRKGGIVEGPRGFVPEHPHFWLYATHFHQDQGSRPASPPPPDGFAELPALASVAGMAWIDRPEDLETLADLHEWDDESILKRFHYRRPGVWVLAVRVRTLDAPLRIPERPEYRGCVSWVPLDRPYPTDGLRPAMDDEEFARVLGRLPIARTLPT